MTYNFTLSTIKPGIRAVVLPDGSTPYLVLSNWNDTSGTWYSVVDFDQEVIDDADPEFDWHKRRPRWDTHQYATKANHATTLPKSPTRAAHECFGTLWKAKRAITEVLEEPRPMVGDATWVRQSAEAAAENAEPEPQPRYRCAECKGTDIQCAVWVNPNTREAFDDFGSWNNIDTQWCNHCGEHTTFETLPTFTVAKAGGAT